MLTERSVADERIEVVRQPMMLSTKSTPAAGCIPALLTVDQLPCSRHRTAAGTAQAFGCLVK
jgi:hypothetical protein